MIVINDTLGVRGGTMTLIYRMCNWYVKNGENVAVLYESDGNDEIKLKIETLGVRTFHVGYFDLKKIGKALSVLSNENNEIKVINFNLNHYLDVEYIRSRKKLPISNTMYVIHPDCLKKGAKVGNRLLQSWYKEINYNLISRMLKKNALVFMDKDTVEATEAFYNKTIQNETPIIPLPIDIPEVDNVEGLIKMGYESKTILTAARADFPFKGYLIGLLDMFEELKKVCHDARLKIYSDGEDIEKLKNRINLLKEDYRRDVELCGWIDYEGLINEIKGSHVFIGASTGLLDSSKCFRVSIPVKHSTNLCVSLSFFYENPLLLSEKYQKEMNNRCIELLKMIFECSFDEYRKMSLLSFDAVNKYYNENVVMKQLNDAMKGNVEKCLNAVQCAFHGIYQFLNKYRFGS